MHDKGSYSNYCRFIVICVFMYIFIQLFISIYVLYTSHFHLISNYIDIYNSTIAIIIIIHIVIIVVYIITIVICYDCYEYNYYYELVDARIICILLDINSDIIQISLQNDVLAEDTV